MKIAIIHLSDFHVCEKDYFIQKKIDAVASGVSSLRNVDEYIITFTGDLANSGKKNEYKAARHIFTSLISQLKAKSGKFINLLLVPGNHDIVLSKNGRTGSDIQDYYDAETIDSYIDDEIKALANFYTESNANQDSHYSQGIIYRKILNFNGYKIQFNLLNTAPFSTLKHDDKELHYFPSDNLYKIKKDKNSSLCITMMHHSPEWFHWKYKSNLENAIIDNSEFLLIGHEHIKQSKEVSINNSEYMWISNAGKADFSHQNGEDSFNVILIDTETNSFSGYVFTWESNLEIFADKNIVENKNIQNRSTHLVPLPSFSKFLKEDTNNTLEDFTKYFVFPKLVAKTKNDYGKYDEISEIGALVDEICKQKRIIITGETNSGKTTLLKALYLHYSKSKSPLFLSLENTTRINSNNFIKHLFEDQYGDDDYKYILYNRLNKDDKIIIVDGWDLIKDGANKNRLLKTIQENFGTIILGSNNNDMDIVETVKNELIDSAYFYELHIKPFFIEKRNQLIQNICMIHRMW